MTGHTGFKGGWLCLWLKSMGAHVTGYSLAPPTEPNLFSLCNVSNGIKSLIGDIRDFENLNKIFKSASPEIVIHLAAQPLVRYSYTHPIETFETNIMGTVHILEAVRLSESVRSVVIVTSDKCYENKEWDWGYREIDPMGGFDPYSSSKGAAEIVTSAYRRSFFSTNSSDYKNCLIASARAGNVIGGGDWSSDRLIPDFIRAATTNTLMTVRNPEAVRPWQHVLEPIRGYLDLAQALYMRSSWSSSAWNFGPKDSDAKPVKWILGKLSKLWPDPVSLRFHHEDQSLHEAKYLKLDISRARNYLGWKPVLTLDTTIEWIIEWYYAWSQNKDMQRLTINQIERYLKIIEKESILERVNA